MATWLVPVPGQAMESIPERGRGANPASWGRRGTICHHRQQIPTSVRPILPEANGQIKTEAISNTFIDDFRLTTATIRQLVALGWTKPGRTSPNFWFPSRTLISTHQLAFLAVKTLRDILNIGSPNELGIECALFKSPTPRQPKLERTRNTYEFLVRYPWGSSCMNGYRRAARHFGLHTLEDPSSRGNDAFLILIHKSYRVLKGVETISKNVDVDFWNNNFETEMCKRGIRWFFSDWKHWDPEDDDGALASLGWERTIVEYKEGCYRVMLRKRHDNSKKRVHSRI
jgi:hypothetical protein